MILHLLRAAPLGRCYARVVRRGRTWQWADVDITGVVHRFRRTRAAWSHVVLECGPWSALVALHGLDVWTWRGPGLGWLWDCGHTPGAAPLHPAARARCARCGTARPPGPPDARTP